MATSFVKPWTSIDSPAEPDSLLVPTLEVLLPTHDGRLRRTEFLVDSGADISMAPRRLCDALGLDWDTGEPIILNGISSKPECAVAARVFVVEMLIPEIGVALAIPICFADADASLLLGRKGFFECFRITFDMPRMETLFELIED